MTSHSRLVATPSPFSSSSKTSNTAQEQPHLSGAYIRSLVKQLSFSSSTARSRAQHLDTMASATPLDHQQQPRQEQERKPQVKKQVRRRMHTSRPYQESLLNMPEARREIVTALKIHRANMRHQSRYQQEQLQRQQQQVQVVFQEQSQAVGGVPVAAPMSYGSFSNHSHNSPLAHLIAGTTVSTVPGSYSSSSHDYLTPLEVPAIGGLDGHGLEHLACSLPAQPLGLNLSFQGFAGSVDDAKDCDDLFGIPLIQSSPASSYSAYSSPAMEMMASTYGSPALSTTEKYSSVDAPAPLGPVLDDGDMDSIGERQGMEWSETAAASSAWWSKILESMESGGGGESAGPEEGSVGTAEDVVAAGLPAEWRWLCDGVGEQGAVAGAKQPDVVETMHVVDGDYNCCYEGGHSDDGEDITLPCMNDIGDIEGWDGEWFSCS